jgi:hypothetical protein
MQRKDKPTFQFVKRAAAKVRLTARTVSLASRVIKYLMKPKVKTRKGGVMTN